MLVQDAVPVRELRCAVYTRRSVDLSVEQEFNSLEAQRAICSSYIASQRPKGWVELCKHYDDAGRTGANLRRPALQELLTDVESGLVDAVIVYKLDRITRTLLDFVRLADLFDGYRVHFVSVTQNFDTGDSTGRLILNILLTFAQFEREISSDRLRDKFGAMKERGMFIGGHPPFGFDLVGKKLIVNSAEASVVRWAFQQYLKVASYVKVAQELEVRQVARRDRVSKRGNLVRGRKISKSSVWQMLGNPIYVGDVRHHGRQYPGAHDAIVSRDLWERVQALRVERTRAKVVEVHKTDLLRGLMHDAQGRTVGVFRDYRYNKQGTRYYLSNQSEWGRRNGVRRYRTKADELEKLVLAVVICALAKRESIRGMLMSEGIHDRSLDVLTKSASSSTRMLERLTPKQLQCALKALIERIELSENAVQIVLRLSELRPFLEWSGTGLFRGQPGAWSRPHKTHLIEVPTSTVRVKRDLRHLLVQRGRTAACVPNAYLVSLIRRARTAQAMLDERRELTLSAMAEKFHLTHSRVPRLVRLNYLAPDIIAAILDGNQPDDLTGHKLMATDLPMDWHLQRRILGFPDQPDTLKVAPGW